MTAAPPHLRYADTPHPAAEAPPAEQFPMEEVLALVPAVTFRQVDYWVRLRYVIANVRNGGGTGNPRRFPWSELVIIRRMGELVAFGFEPRRAAVIARKLPVRGSYTHQGITLRITVEHTPQTAPQRRRRSK